jgi:hypothetical protein
MGPGAEPWESLQIRSIPAVKGGAEPSGMVTFPLIMSG